MANPFGLFVTISETASGVSILPDRSRAFSEETSSWSSRISRARCTPDTNRLLSTGLPQGSNAPFLLQGAAGGDFRVERSSGVLGNGHVRGALHCGIDRGEREPRRRPLADLGFEVERTIVLLDDGRGKGKTQP